MRVTMVPTNSIFDEQKGERRLPASYIEWMSNPRDLLRKPSEVSTKPPPATSRLVPKMT